MEVGSSLLKEGNSDFTSERNINIDISEDRMEAYITITYSPVKRNEKDDNRTLPLYTIKEIKEALDKFGIIYGIVEENLQKCISENGVRNLLIAKGTPPEDGEDDILDIKFEVDKDIKKLHEDSKGRVDYKSIGAVSGVHEGDVLAVKIPGKDGTDGKDIRGKLVKCRKGKRIKIRAAQGCEMKDSNTITATISGKPCMKNNVFYVYAVHEVPSDVNLETGNIMFLSDIIIKGNVREGMKVISGNSINVHENVLGAEIKAKSDITVNGNVISSTLIGGGEDVNKLKEMEVLKELRKTLEHLIDAVEEIKKYNLLGYDISDGQVIKLLIENKFKSITKLCLNMVSHIIKSWQENDTQGDILLTFLKNKLLGLAPLNIKHYSELFDIRDEINERLNFLESTLSLPVNIKLLYCQDSTINSSGDIIVFGKGSYVSNLYAYGSIYFIEDSSVVRGGTIKAGKEIRCKTVGSIGGVTTRLITDVDGHIYAQTAYENTIFVVGGREFISNYASKNVHVYMNDKSELVVDKLRL